MSLGHSRCMGGTGGVLVRRPAALDAALDGPFAAALLAVRLDQVSLRAHADVTGGDLGGQPAECSPKPDM
jgi:hypothetical protein